ncbi:DUF397 domain-containing protein [Spirillospora sp. CA-253888]
MTGVQWRKSSHSNTSGGDCVEVADLAAGIAVRDSKDPDGGRLAFDAAAWRMFAQQVRRGEHDLP